MIPRGLATRSLGCLLSLLFGASGWAGEVETPTPEAAAHQPFSLQQALGHAHVSTTQNYVNYSRTRLKRTIQRYQPNV